MLQTTLFDPTHAWIHAVNECGAHHNKPMTILIGHQTGERASGEDITSWNNTVMDRQNGFATRMIKEFIKELQSKFSFPMERDFINVVWRDLNESTAEQKANLAKTRVETNKLAIDSRMQPIYETDYIQSEAGAPIIEVVPLDDGEDEPAESIDTDQ